MSNIIAPVPIGAMPLDRVPQLGSPTFDEDALQFTEWEANVLAPGANALAANVHHNAQQAAGSAAAANQARQTATEQAALAAQHAASAGAASNARSWSAGQSWQVNDVVWGVTAPGALYRCTQAHSGSSTPPEQDRARWAPVGARTVLDPLAGPASVTVQRDGQGRIASVTSTYDGRPATTTLQRGADGLVSQVVTQYDGRTRTSTVVRSGGRIQSINTEVA